MPAKRKKFPRNTMVGVAMSDVEVAALDAYQERHNLRSRSAAARQLMQAGALVEADGLFFGDGATGSCENGTIQGQKE